MGRLGEVDVNGSTQHMTAPFPITPVQLKNLSRGLPAAVCPDVQLFHTDRSLTATLDGLHWGQCRLKDFQGASQTLSQERQ
jgi:hypothetical protein